MAASWWEPRILTQCLVRARHWRLDELSRRGTWLIAGWVTPTVHHQVWTDRHPDSIYRNRLHAHRVLVVSTAMGEYTGADVGLQGVIVPEWIYQPIVSPNVASLGYSVTALLIILIGEVGTLNGALVGAVVFCLLDYGLRCYIGESASFINGAIYVAIVLFLPYGIVGT